MSAVCVGSIFLLSFPSILLTLNYLIDNIRNPGHFAKLSGASRRKMNIKSSIDREPDQQCQIVDPSIPRDAEGRYNNWGPLFEGIGLKRLESGAMELQCPK